MRALCMPGLMLCRRAGRARKWKVVEEESWKGKLEKKARRKAGKPTAATNSFQ